MIELNPPETEWDVTYDRSVVKTLEEMQRSSGNLHDNVRKTLLDIVENPLKGSPKTGELKGYRATHIEHLVIVWELRSEDGGSPITKRTHIDKLEEVYIHGIAHHDNMTSTVSGADRPAKIERVWGVRFNGYDVQKEISILYDVDGAEIVNENWSNENGVVVSGTATEGVQNQIKEKVPESAEFRTGDQRVSI